MRDLRPLSLLLFSLLAGCSSFGPTEPASLRAGDAIRVELTRQQTSAVAEELGGFRESLTGTVQEADGGGVGLTISAVQGQALPAGRSFRSYLYLPWDGVRVVERRTFSLVRTSLLATAGAATAWALLELATGGGGADGEGTNTNSQRVSIPVFGFIF